MPSGGESRRRHRLEDRAALGRGHWSKPLPSAVGRGASQQTTPCGWPTQPTGRCLASTLATVRVVTSVLLGNPPQDVVGVSEGTYVTVGSSGAEQRGGGAQARTSPRTSIPSTPRSRGGASPAGGILEPDERRARRLPEGRRWPGRRARGRSRLVAARPHGGWEDVHLPAQAGHPLLERGPGAAGRFPTRPRAGFRARLGGAPYYTGIVGADRSRKGKSCELSRGIVADGPAGDRHRSRLREPDGDFLMNWPMPWAYAVPVSTPSHEVSARARPRYWTVPDRRVSAEGQGRSRLIRNTRFREWSPDAQPQGFPNSISLSWRYERPIRHIRATEGGVTRGRSDVALGSGPPLSKDDHRRLAARYPGQLHVSTTFVTAYLFLNTRLPPFDDVHVRRAVNHAFDSDTYVERLGGRLAPTCQILPPNFPGYRPTCLYAFGGLDGLNRARRQVAGAGVVGTQVTVWVPEPGVIRARYVASVLQRSTSAQMCGPCPSIRQGRDDRLPRQGRRLPQWSADRLPPGGSQTTRRPPPSSRRFSVVRHAGLVADNLSRSAIAPSTRRWLARQRCR